MVDSKQFRIVTALLGVIGAALIVLVLVLVLSDDGGDSAAPGSTTAGPTTSALPATTGTPTSTEAPATTAPIATTTTVPPSTTAAPEPSTSTSTSTTTTTTVLPVPPIVLQDNGIGGVAFGTDPETAIAYAESHLGPVENDTGWIEAGSSKYGVCPGDVVRGVEWGVDAIGYGFVLLFTESPTTHLPGGEPHLFGYYYFGDPAGLQTESGIGVGSTVGDALIEHAGSSIEEHPLVPGDGFWLFDTDVDDQAVLYGFADGVAGTDTLRSVNGGSTCGE